MVNNALSNQMNNSTKLNNGINMPLLGLGVYDMYKEAAEQAVEDALTIGYRLIDTASMYENEIEIGNGIKRSGINREEIFLTTKLNNTDHGYDQALNAFDDSLKKLGQDYVDLYLIHWPIKEGRAASWKALEKLYADKRVKAIGVANYNIALLEELKSTERQLYDHLIAIGKLQKEKPHKGDETIEKLKNQFEILRGEYDAGNNNPNIKKQIKTILYKLYHFGKIQMTEVKEFLKQL